jgi:SAM-dependent methyltransferase
MSSEQETVASPPKDYLWLHLRELPYFRSLLRAVEARFYRDIKLPSPVLDIGSGDGHFATIAFNDQVDVGLDPSSRTFREAKLRGGYRFLIQADGGNIPFPAGYFNSGFSNSVLEHIPHVQNVLDEIGRVLKPGAPFVFCVPNHQFSSSLSIGLTLDRFKLHRLGDTYRSFFNRIARHQHLDPPEVWSDRLERSGFHVDRWWHYYPPSAMHVTEWGHYFGLPSLVSYKLTGRWVVFPTSKNRSLVYKLTKPHYERAPEQEDGVCTFYITHRIDI